MNIVLHQRSTLEGSLAGDFNSYHLIAMIDARQGIEDVVIVSRPSRLPIELANLFSVRCYTLILKLAFEEICF